MRTVIQGSGRSLDEHAAPLRADRLRVVDHPAFVTEQAAREAAGGRPQGPERVKAMTTGAQIRAARELLGWRQAELAKRARIQAHSVESAESSLDQSVVPGQDMQAMRAVLEAAGVEFTNRRTRGEA